MHYIALVPGFLCLYLLRKWGLEKTILAFFLPLVVIVPDYYKALIIGLPDLSFIQGAIIPVSMAVVYKHGKLWRPAVTDVFVVLLAAISIISEYRASGYADAQNYIVDMMTYIVFPYIIGRLFIEQNGLRLAVAKQLVICACIVVVFFMAYEWRFAINPYQQILSRFFPGQGDGWVVTFRFGMPRAAGPYAHAILAGIMFAVYYRLMRWVMWQHVWPEKFPWYKRHPLRLDQLIFLIILAGVLFNGAKGPWLGGLIGGLLVTASRVPYRKLYLRALLILTLVVLVPMGVQAWHYASVGRANATSVNQETAAYRKELIDKYLGMAIDKATFGWGKTKVPKIPGAESIDNYFLLLSLMHGIYAAMLLFAIFVSMIFRLWRRANRESSERPNSDQFGWTLLGIFVAYLVSLATVYMAYQVMLMFFLLAGWAETYLQRGLPALNQGTTQAGPASPPAVARFRRVMR